MARLATAPPAATCCRGLAAGELIIMSATIGIVVLLSSAASPDAWPGPWWYRMDPPTLR